MGRDKLENEDLIRFGWPLDVWFHVNDMVRLPSTPQRGNTPPPSLRAPKLNSIIPQLILFLVLSFFLSLLILLCVCFQSSAHVYLRMEEGMTIKQIPPLVLEDCAQLVKANSIEGNKKTTGKGQFRSTAHNAFFSIEWMQSLQKFNGLVGGQRLLLV